YRKSLNFTIDGLEGTARRLERLTDFAQRLREARPVEADDTALMYEIEKSQEAFEAGMDDDLNTAQGLAAVTLLETALNRAMAEERLTEKAKTLGLDVLGKMDGVFGFFDPFVDESLDAEIQALVDERLAARKAKNFARSDEIRQILADRGIILEDTRDGTRWKRK
ncbi:MAG TPA: cysteine--tRNA ligase, partial [Acidobacteriota bacterium]|nr:cysteine--tRNA ligase [Acidobacteriota bacterium]